MIRELGSIRDCIDALLELDGDPDAQCIGLHLWWHVDAKSLNLAVCRGSFAAYPPVVRDVAETLGCAVCE